MSTPGLIQAMVQNSGGGDTTATASPSPVAPVQPGDLGQSPNTLPATAPSIPLQPTDQRLEDLRKQSYGSKVYRGIMNALGGSQDVTFDRDETGKMVAHTTPSTPGMQWKRIISGALTGFEGGQEAGTQGPGGAMRGLAGGIKAGAAGRQAQETRERGQADEDYKAKLETATGNLNRSLLANKVAQSTWELGDEQRKAEQADLDLFNNYQQMIQTGGPGTDEVGVFKNFEEAQAATNQYKQLHNIHAEGRTFLIPNIVNGQKQGVRAAVVTPDWLHAKTTEDHTFAIPEYKQVDGKWQWVDTAHTVPAGETNENLSQWMMASAIASNQRAATQSETHLKDVQAQELPEESKARNTEAAASMMRAQTDQSKAASEIALNDAKAQAERDKVSEADFGPEGAKGFDKWHKDMVQPALAVEQIYRMSSQVYNEREELRKKGKTFDSGAQSVQMLSNHIAGTFGNVKGARITRDMIEKHLGARSVSDSLLTGIQHLTSGQVLSDNQWNAFFEMIGQRREETWQTVMDDGKALGRPLQLVAFPEDFRQRHGLPSRVPGAGAALQQQPPGAGGAGASPQGRAGGAGPAAQSGAGKSISLTDAKALPQYKGKSDAEISAAATALGYTVTQ
jgi:hypothetical protein